MTLDQLRFHGSLLSEWLSDFSCTIDLQKRPKSLARNTLMCAAGSETSSTKFYLGTGASILRKAFAKILETVSHELVFVTCFWAESDSRQLYADLLRDLSAKALAQPSHKKIRVRLCFSSFSVVQKLFDLRSERGHIHQPNTWSSKLGLPAPSELEGLDLQVMSMFQRPFSVMHPKFIIADRKTCFLPSCNISWENWFEGCVELQGSIVQEFLEFWQSFWMRQEGFLIPSTPDWNTDDPFATEPHSKATSFEDDSHSASAQQTALQKSTDYITSSATKAMSDRVSVPALFLPSQHFRYPRFRPFPCQSAPRPAATPLNSFTLELIHKAKESIYVQTPNVTSPPVLHAILSALSCNINVRIVTNSRLMTNEQLVTAGTTTARCLHRLVQNYEANQRKLVSMDVEQGQVTSMGDLVIQYFTPKPAQLDPQIHRHQGPGYPTHTHLKLTIVDGEVVILGSGNMDRASWYTSQELSVAFFSAETASRIASQVGQALEGCLETFYSSVGATGGVTRTTNALGTVQRV